MAEAMASSEQPSPDLRSPQVMGVLNVTPDSFSDGGLHATPGAAIDRARELVENGARIIDIGGESTRPGADPVEESVELERVIPVVEAIAGELDVLIAVDTSKPAVMRAAVEAGAGLINDVRALREDQALTTAAELDVPVVLMHMQGEPGTMQDEPYYSDVVTEVMEFLEERVLACERVGIPRERVVLDPGFGFGKTLDHNLELMKHLDRFQSLGLPLLVGVSRKSIIGGVLESPLSERLYGGVALAALAIWQNASIIRTHDVRETLDAVRMIEAVRNA
ncbi:MAG: dihydropteroate synthase [Pseudomonadota bacterium]